MIDGADDIENVCSMEIVIRNMIFLKKKRVDYKNYTKMGLNFMQTIKDQKSFKARS